MSHFFQVKKMLGLYRECLCIDGVKKMMGDFEICSALVYIL